MLLIPCLHSATAGCPRSRPPRRRNLGDHARIAEGKEHALSPFRFYASAARLRGAFLLFSIPLSMLFDIRHQ